MLPGTRSATTPAVDTGTRQLTRSLLLFSLSGRVRPRAPRTGSARLVDRYDFGRFTPHLVSGDAVLPSVALAERLAPDDLGLPARASGPVLTEVSLLVVTTPREDATLVLDCGFSGDADAESVAAWLAATCFQREGLTLGGRPILAEVSSRLGLESPLRFGLNVHQLVFPGGQLLDQVLSGGMSGDQQAPPLVSTMVYRGQIGQGQTPGGAAFRLGVSVPPPMNNPGVTLVAHGRGVSVLAGWAEHVENGLSLVAVAMMSALAVLQRSRLTAFAMLDANQHAALNSATELRDLISTLSAGVNELQLDLGFGVEAYVDSLLIPEMLIEAFQSSLRDALSVRDSLDNCSRMVERLTSVVNARSAALDAAVAERNEHRERTLSFLLAAATLLSLPPALLLAYFGVNGTNVDAHRSIFDLSAYGPAYAVAWLPFMLLVLIGYLLRRRFNRLSAATLVPPADPRVTLPPPRPPQAR